MTRGRRRGRRGPSERCRTSPRTPTRCRRERCDTYAAHHHRDAGDYVILSHEHAKFAAVSSTDARVRVW